MLQLQTTGAWSRSLWLFDPRAADIQAIEGMKSSILSASARWEILQVIGGREKEEGKRRGEGGACCCVLIIPLPSCASLWWLKIPCSTVHLSHPPSGSLLRLCSFKRMRADFKHPELG